MFRKTVQILLCIAAATVSAAPVAFQLPDELISRAPKNLQAELNKSSVNTPAYTATAMKILENRIQKRMKLMEFTLNKSEVVKAMALPETFSPSSVILKLSPAERKKLFASGKDKIQLLVRYTKSFRLRQETIRLFRQCNPVMPENRFHSLFFSYLELQHIYLEQELIKFQTGVR